MKGPRAERQTTVIYSQVTQDVLHRVISSCDTVESAQRDAMAIPTYLHRNPLIRWLFHRRYERIAGLLDVPAGGAVLEFGCGVGTFLPSLSAAGLRVYATDLVLDYARNLNERLALDVEFVEDLARIPNKTLNAIVAADVLEHVDDLPSLLEVMGEKLEDGGILIVSSPTENFAYRIGRIAAGFAGKGDYHHEDARSVEAMIAASDSFALERSVTLPWSLPPHLFRIVRFRKERNATDRAVAPT